jgi:hypothetical protein
MNEKWYYVEDGERKGPISQEELKKLTTLEILTQESYVWTKGLKDWKKLQEFPNLISSAETSPPLQENFTIKKVSQIFQEPKNIEPPKEYLNVQEFEKVFFIKTGLDRSFKESCFYGPYHLKKLQELFFQKRINGYTLVFFKGLTHWIYLAELDDYRNLFEENPPEISMKAREEKSQEKLISIEIVLATEEILTGVGFRLSTGSLECLLPQHSSLKKNLQVKLYLNKYLEIPCIIKETYPTYFLRFQNTTNSNIESLGLL